jgi:hypothetical protein
MNFGLIFDKALARAGEVPSAPLWAHSDLRMKAVPAAAPAVFRNARLEEECVRLRAMTPPLLVRQDRPKGRDL